MHLTVENTVQDYEKSLHTTIFKFKCIVRKLEIRPVPFFFFLTHADPQLPLSKFLSYSMLNLVLIHFSDQEVCNVYRSRGNTTAACKHVTRYFLFFSSFLKSIVPFFHSGNSESKGWYQSPMLLMLVEEQT